MSVILKDLQTSPNLVPIRENTDQKKFYILTFLTQCILSITYDTKQRSTLMLSSVTSNCQIFQMSNLSRHDEFHIIFTSV